MKRGSSTNAMDISATSDFWEEHPGDYRNEIEVLTSKLGGINHCDAH
jgi:hypothetical protein